MKRKATVFKAPTDLKDLGFDVEYENLKIGNECYFFTNTDRTDPRLPFDTLVAAFPIKHYFIVKNEE